jgi:hypothetical protein
MNQIGANPATLIYVITLFVLAAGLAFYWANECKKREHQLIKARRREEELSVEIAVLQRQLSYCQKCTPPQNVAAEPEIPAKKPSKKKLTAAALELQQWSRELGEPSDL